MVKNLGKNVFTAIDIGTTKICVLVASQDMSGNLDLIGFGQYPSYGLKKGVIVNIAKTVESIKLAVKQAEEMANIKIDSAVVGISGGHIQSFNSTGVVGIKNSDVTQEDINRVIDAAKAVAIPQDQEILHILPQYFKIDGQEQIVDSLGMHGVRLEAQVHIITGAVSSAQNIIKSCELAGISVTDIVLEQIASADSVLTPTEKELGVGILDIGGGTSDFAIYKDGRIIHSKVIPLAGNHFTNDLAVSLGISLLKAEELKKTAGFVYSDNNQILDFNKKILIDSDIESEKKEIDLNEVSEVLRFRAEEIFDILLDEIVKFKLISYMPSGLVLTGGGSLLKGISGLSKERFQIPVRIGFPCNYKKNLDEKAYCVPDLLKSPIYSTGYGLMLYSAGKSGVNIENSNENKNLVSKVFSRMKSWIYDFI